MDMVEKLVETAESLGWIVSLETQANADGDEERNATFEICSPAGEDFLFEFYFNGASEFVCKVREECNDFDPDQHVEDLIIAKHNGFEGVPRASVLVEDSEWIDEMLLELSERLIDAYTEMNREDENEEE